MPFLATCRCPTCVKHGYWFPSIPHWCYIGPIGELPLSFCPFRFLSLSRHGQVQTSLLSLCFAIFFSSFFYLLTALNLWFGVLWRVLFITPKAFFFFFFYPTHCYTLLYIYIYIYCFFTQPCLINYNVHYEFSDFCFCASCLFSFYVFSLMLNVAYLNFWFVL